MPAAVTASETATATEATADGSGALLVITSGETTAQRAQLDQAQDIGVDEYGFRYRKHEALAVDLDPAAVERLQAAGYVLKSQEVIAGLGTSVFLFQVPTAINGDEALMASLDSLIGGTGTFGLNHLFDRASVQARPARGAVVPQRAACACRIGIIDTGVAAQVDDIRSARLEQRGFNGQVATPGVHGTIVASLIAGHAPQNGEQTQIFVADIFSGPRETAGSSVALIRALGWMAEQGVGVINLSLAGPANKAVEQSLARLAARGHVIVAAAGNDGPAAPPAFPAAYPDVVAVTAVDGQKHVYRYANRGSYIDFAARGVDVVGLDQRGQTQVVTGTSFASPVVAMQLARSLSRPNPARASSAVKALEARAQDVGAVGRDPVFGAGLIDN